MAKAKFGWKQFNQTTPAFIGKLRKFLLYIIGGFGVLSPFFISTFHWTTEDITNALQILGGTVFVLGGILTEFFGVNISSETVPKEQVTEVETN